jgi:rhamnosyltransferase
MEYEYRNTHVFEINCPNIGPAVALYYDRAALRFSINYCKEHNIEDPIFYVLTCRIGLFINGLVRNIRKIGGKYFLNPDGHEWKRAKWSKPVRAYWKWSEKKMVNKADLVICDSVNIEKYIQEEYGVKNTTYIAYGADLKKSELSDDDPKFINWLESHGLTRYGYYMCCGRFVPENSFEIMIREFMASNSKRDFAIITTNNDSLLEELENKLHWRSDKRIKFVGTVYDSELLKKIRENAYGNFHGHTVGGTNPSLLEALGSTDLNLLINVGFNQEVAREAALYWSPENGDLAKLIDQADSMSEEERAEFGVKAKARIRDAFSWKFIGDEYMRVWNR